MHKNNIDQQQLLQGQQAKLQQQQLQGQQQHQQQQQQQQQMIMPTPSAAPWNLDSMPWKLASINRQTGSVMQFSAAPQNADDTRLQFHQKRKSDLSEQPCPSKQFISEERITAHFNGLHISSNYIQNSTGSGAAAAATSTFGDGAEATVGKCFTNLTYQDYQVTAKELEEKLKNASRITMCEQVRKLHEKQKKAAFLPELLLNRVEKPCTALMLWQPPLVIDLAARPDGQSTPEGINAEGMFDNQPEVADAEIEDFENNNSCSLDLNNPKLDRMEEDL